MTLEKQVRICLHHSPLEKTHDEFPLIGANASLLSSEDEVLHEEPFVAETGWSTQLSMGDIKSEKIQHSKYHAYRSLKLYHADL
jgi:hypothetical protein